MKYSRTAALVVFGACSTAASAQPRMLNVGDASIRYEDTGRGQALVFIHGWAMALEIWDDQARAFSPRYRVIRFDRRGFGRSSGFADISADAADLRVLLDSLDIRSAHIVGLSAGSRVALRFALAFPDRLDGLVLYGAPPSADFPVARSDRPPVANFGEIARQHGLDSMRKAVLNSPLAWMPPGRPDLIALVNRGMAEYAGRDLLDPRPESGRVPEARWDQMHTVRAPTLIVHGDHELPLFMAFADSLLRRIPNARKVVITDAGHGAHFAQPEQFNAALQSFLDTLPGARRQ